MFVLISSLMAVESDKENVNEKFKFIEDIYSESWALIIGINDYQNVDPLSFAVDDAIAINNILTEKYGFKKEHIRLITNEDATKDNIMNGFQDILLSAGEKDRIVVFYAGHGDTYPLPNGGDMGYLIPVDGEATKDKIFLTSISMSTLEELATMSAAKHILYLVDACYGGLTLSTRGLGKEQTPEYLKKMTKEKGRQVITAGGKDEKVMEKAEWGHSAFTKNIISGLKNELADANNDGIISGEELGGFIRSGVAIDTEGQHTPQKGRIGSDVGEFVFISQILQDDVAGMKPNSDEKLASVDAELAEIKKLLLLQAQQGQAAPIPSKKTKKPTNMKTAATLSWIFPGMGHYYSGSSGKGLFFTVLEVASLAGVAVFSSEYTRKQDEYTAAQAGYDLFTQNIKAGASWTPEERDYWVSKRQAAFDAQNQTLQKMAGAGTTAAVVWLWNIWDVKKSSKNYSSNYPTSVGINQQGQVTFTINLR